MGGVDDLAPQLDDAVVRLAPLVALLAGLLAELLQALRVRANGLLFIGPVTAAVAGVEVRAATEAASSRLALIVVDVFGLDERPANPHPRQHLALLRLIQPRQLERMANFDGASFQRLAHGLDSFEQLHATADVARRLCQRSCDGLDGRAWSLKQLAVGLRLFHRRQVLALQVRDDAHFSRFGVRHLTHFAGARLLSGEFRCQPAPLAGYNLEARTPLITLAGRGPHNQRFDHAIFRDRLRQLRKRGLIDGLARLFRREHELTDRNLPHLTADHWQLSISLRHCAPPVTRPRRLSQTNSHAPTRKQTNAYARSHRAPPSSTAQRCV